MTPQQAVKAVVEHIRRSNPKKPVVVPLKQPSLQELLARLA